MSIHRERRPDGWRALVEREHERHATFAAARVTIAVRVRALPSSADRLAERARAVARGQLLGDVRDVRAARVGARQRRLLVRVDDTRRVLADVRARLAAAALSGADVSPAGDWLLDNYHVIDEHMREVRASLPRGYYRELPELAAGRLAGYPRVYEMATTLIGHSEGRVDRANVELFVGAFQEVTPLSLGELWAVPAMLRLALIESVRRTALRTVRWMDETEAADHWAARLLGAEPDALDDFLAHHPPLTPTFVSRFLRQSRLAAADSHTSIVWLEP